MNKDTLNAHFESMTPSDAQKARMRKTLLAGHSHQPQQVRSAVSRRRRLRWAIPAAALALLLTLFLALPFGGETSAYAISVRVGEDGTVFKLEENHRPGADASTSGASISKVDPRPGLEFYIDGPNIAKIEFSTENEYIYAVDWTKTQHEKYWNSEYYQHFDEKRQISIADFSKLYDKSMTMTFDEGFSDYDQIWYRWTAWNLHQWASEDNYSRFLGAGMSVDGLSEQDKAKLAAGENSGIGHIQLEGYPEKLLEDKITVVITDRQGNRTTKVIHIKISSNELLQTVVTASLGD